jgi:hypothetical protein
MKVQESMKGEHDGRATNAHTCFHSPGGARRADRGQECRRDWSTASAEAPLLSHWNAQLLERASEIFGTMPNGSEPQGRIAALEQMVGRLTLELEVAKKLHSL